MKKFSELNLLNIKEKKKLSPKELVDRLRMIAKAVEKQNKKNADRAKKDAMKMMKDTGMFDEGLGDASLAINPKTVKQSKPLLMKHAKKFGIDLEFGMGGRMPSVLQMKGSSGAVKNFLASIQKDRRLMGLIDD